MSGELNIESIVGGNEHRKKYIRKGWGRVVGRERKKTQVGR